MVSEKCIPNIFLVPEIPCFKFMCIFIQFLVSMLNHIPNNSMDTILFSLYKTRASPFNFWLQCCITFLTRIRKIIFFSFKYTFLSCSELMCFPKLLLVNNVASHSPQKSFLSHQQTIVKFKAFNQLANIIQEVFHIFDNKRVIKYFTLNRTSFSRPVNVTSPKICFGLKVLPHFQIKKKVLFAGKGLET